MSANTTTRRSVEVKPSSVPLCLRHGATDTPMLDAQCLAAFLQHAVENLTNGDFQPSADVMSGMSLCFDLLRDKLSIAAGDREWPQVAVSDDDTWRTLTNMNAGGEHDHE